MDNDYCDIAAQYAADVLAGKLPCGRFVAAACRRQAQDLERWDGKPGRYSFNRVKANRICEFISLLPHIKGPVAGQRIILEPWQVFILTTVFGWVKPDGKRRFRRSYVEVPRGNGKSCLSSGVGLYMLAADGEQGAECYSLATTRDQAKIVFGDAQQMARKSPEFRRAFGVAVNAHNIHVLSSGSKFEALSAEGSTLDGLNIHFGCIDELHAHKTRTVYDVVETATGKRDQSLLWIITTAGSDRSGVCYEVRNFVTQILNGVTVDDTQFGIIHGIEETDDWATEEALVKANPNWNISVRPDVVLPLQSKAMHLPSAQSNFMTKHLNVWCNADSPWMDMRAWTACGNSLLSLEDFAGEPCYVGIDLAQKVDLVALVLLFKRDEHYYAFGKYYLAEESVFEARNSQYQGWQRQGYLTATPGNITDYAYIESDLQDIAVRFEVREVAVDPHNAAQFVTRMTEQGLPMILLPQNFQTFSEPMKELEKLVLSSHFHHTGDPVLAWMVSNVTVKPDRNENIFPRKERPENKIDGLIALALAMNRAMLGKPNDEAEFNAYIRAPLRL